MAYFKLRGRIEIVRKSDGQKLTFEAFNSIEIERDTSKINSSCKIRIPTSARLRNQGKEAFDSVQTGKQFDRGDKVSVWLGYDDDRRLEYEGFIFRVNFKTPLEIECEGYEFLLRTPCESKTWATTTMKEVLQHVIAGTGLQLHELNQHIPFTKFIIAANMTRLEVLQKIKSQYGLTIFFLGNVLYGGLAYLIDLGAVKYKLGHNTIKDDSLKYRNIDDIRLKIKATGINPDNTKIDVTVGDPEGSHRQLFFYNVRSAEELKKLATEEIKKYKYSGFEGKITTFLRPFAEPCMKAVLDDPQYDERKGTYYITKTSVRANRNGGRRTIDIAVKI